jgi:chromosome condensin MukBEF ATPase and DNA-binding subunit MukB
MTDAAFLEVIPLFQELTLKLYSQEQLNAELRASCNELEQRLQQFQVENIHMQNMRFKQLMDEEENRRTAGLLLEANNSLTSLRQNYEEDMLEVQGLSRMLQQQILSLQKELAEAKEGLKKSHNNAAELGHFVHK